MNPNEKKKILAVSRTPILHRNLRKLKTMTSKYLKNDDEFEKSTALIIEDEELQKNLIVRKLPKNFKWFWAKSVKESIELYKDL